MREPNCLDKLPQDKLLHYAIGTVVASVVSVGVSQLAALATVVATAIFIEVYQYKTKTGKVELLDMAATLLGGLTVLVGIHYGS